MHKAAIRLRLQRMRQAILTVFKKSIFRTLVLSVVPDFCFILGLVIVIYGIDLIHRPTAVIIGGLCLCALSLVVGGRHVRKRDQ